MENLKQLTTLGSSGLKTAYLALQSLALFLTLALGVILAVAYLVIKFKFKDKLESFKTLALGIVVGYAVTLTICISFFMIARLKVKEEIDKSFYLVLGFLALALVYSVSAIFCHLNKLAFKLCNYIGVGLLAIYVIVLIIVLPTAGEDYAPLSTAGMYTFTGIIVAGACALIIIFGKDGGSASQSKALAYAGVSIALSFALSYIKLFSLPQGGSVTLASMLPLIIYSYIFGARKGVLAGVIYGALQCLQSPQIYQPMQVIIDYPIAFGLLGLSGIVKNLNFLNSPLKKFIFGASIACVLRYIAHTISGYYVFSSWAMEGYTALSWALVYNLYLIAELAIILVVGVSLFLSKAMVKQLESVNPTKPNKKVD